MYKIYRITFEDGCQYVGFTQYSVEDRIRRHISKPCNTGLKNRLVRMQYETEILHENVSATEVYTLESQEIYRLKKPINIMCVSVKRDGGNAPSQDTQRNRKGRVYPKRAVLSPRKGKYRCSICCEQKPHTEFCRDVSRFNGLNSRCKVCDSLRLKYGLEVVRKLVKSKRLAKENGLFFSYAMTDARSGLRRVYTDADL